MPYQIVKHGNKFSVVNTQSGKVFSKNSTKRNAVKQERLLRGLEYGMVLKVQPKNKKK